MFESIPDVEVLTLFGSTIIAAILLVVWVVADPIGDPISTYCRPRPNIMFQRRFKDSGNHITLRLGDEDDKYLVKALSSDSKELVEGYLVDNGGLDQSEVKVDDGAYRVVLKHTVGFFTGLRDKNGNRVFVGDVIKLQGKGICPNSSYYFVIEDYRWYGPIRYCLGHEFPLQLPNNRLHIPSTIVMGETVLKSEVVSRRVYT